VFTRFLFWPWFTGLIFLIIGLFAMQRNIARAAGIDKLVVLGPIFFASPLAVFGAEHLAGARFLMQLVPGWMPGRLFWAYFVGVALIASAISFTLGRHVRLSGTLVGVMFLLFVVLVHLPNAAAHPKDRFAWAVVLRDFSFGFGAWAYAASQEWNGKRSNWMVAVGRFGIGIALLFFAIEHFLHPTFAPGVPLEKVTPPWIPAPSLWGYLTGAILLAGSIVILGTKRGSLGAALVGLLMVVLTIVIYSPLLVVAKQGSEINEAVNYIADTLLFGGALLLLAQALRRESSSHLRMT
jgi:uncharacterized membrane protein